MMQVLQGQTNHLHTNTIGPSTENEVDVSSEASSKPQNKRAKMHPINNDFAQLLSGSTRKLSTDDEDRIAELIEFSEAKVFESITAPPNNYLRHVLSVRGQDTMNKVQNLVEGRELEIQTALYASDLAIRRKPKLESIRKRQEKISLKLSQMSAQMGNLSQLINKDTFEEMMNGKYWEPNSKGTAQARQFVKKLRQQKREARVRLKEERARSEHQLQLQEKRRLQMQDKKLQERIKHSVEKLKEYKKHREEEKAHMQEKIKSEQVILEKYRSQSLQMKMRSEEQEKQLRDREERDRLKKLNDLKSKHRPMDLVEMQEHQRQYLQRKSRMQEEINRRMAEGILLSERQKEELAKLYKCHYHDELSKEEVKIDDRKERGKSVLDKIASFQENVLSEHRPRVDEKKRKEMQQLIQQVDNRGKRGRKKVLENGQIIFEETAPPTDHRKLGVQYLQQLRKMHSQKGSRKVGQLAQPQLKSLSKVKNGTDLSSSMHSAREYLHEGVKGLKSTLSKWKRDLENESVPRDQRYSMVLKKVEVIDEVARQKEQKLRVLKDQSKQVMEIKESLDKHYLNSINAKIGVLNKIIYNQK